MFSLAKANRVVEKIVGGINKRNMNCRDMLKACRGRAAEQKEKDVYETKVKH